VSVGLGGGMGLVACEPRAQRWHVIPDFKDTTRYAPYVSLRSQISHIATNKG